MQKAISDLEKRSLHIVGVLIKNGFSSYALSRVSADDAIPVVDEQKLKRSDTGEFTEAFKVAFAVWEGCDHLRIENVKLDFAGMTENQIRVIKAAQKIERGLIMAHDELAEAAGLPNAVGFVRNIMISNRQSPFVSCHHVIAKNGLGGFECGLSPEAQIMK